MIHILSHFQKLDYLNSFLSFPYAQVLYCGKPASLGIKQPGPRSGKWMELPVTKSPKIVHIAVGHDGLHAVLVAEDGSAYFTGTARRGEDGDQSNFIFSIYIYLTSTFDLNLLLFDFVDS